MELKLGIITWRDLSIWFGLKPDSLTKNPKSREKKLKILEKYADFHLENKKIIIDKIYYSTYTKAFDIIEKEFDKEWGKSFYPKTKEVNQLLNKMRIDTSARVGLTIWYKNPELQNQIKIKTAQTYTNQVKREQYGRNYKNEYGTKGYCQSVWMNEKGTEPLDEERLKVLKECANQAYHDKGTIYADIDDDYKKGFLSKEEYREAKADIDTLENYELFKQLVEKKLGFFPEKRTQLIDSVW